jgi:hypothetical protein
LRGIGVARPLQLIGQDGFGFALGQYALRKAGQQTGRQQHFHRVITSG